MRNWVAAILLALVLIAALFVALRFGGRSALEGASAGSSGPAQIAAQVKDGFLGEKQIGAWRLSCVRKQELPKARGRAAHVSEKAEHASEDEEVAPGEWKIPRCRVYLELKDANAPGGGIRITYRRAGFKRLLSLFLRIPPGEVDVGDSVTLRMDKAAQTMSVRNCSQAFCLVREQVKKGGPLSHVAAKTMILQFAQRPSGNHISASIPTDGLDQAVAAMVRVDK